MCIQFSIEYFNAGLLKMKWNEWIQNQIAFTSNEKQKKKIVKQRPPSSFLLSLSLTWNVSDANWHHSTVCSNVWFQTQIIIQRRDSYYKRVWRHICRREQFHTHMHTHTHTHTTHIHTHTHTHFSIHIHTYTQNNSLSLTYTHSHKHIFLLNSHTHTQSLSLSHTRTHSHSHTITITLTYTKEEK